MRVYKTEFDDDYVEFCMLEKGEIIGKINVETDSCYADDGEAYINGVWIVEEFRRQGVATRIMKRVVRHYKDMTMTLHVAGGADNEAAVALYKKFGFDWAGEDEEEDDWVMKRLKQ